MSPSLGLESAVGSRRSIEATNDHDHDQQQEMLWGSLTEDLHVLILGRLPFFSLMRMRTVSKKWNSLILSPEITPPHTKFTPKSMLLYFGHGPLLLFDSLRNKWEEQYLDFIPYPRSSLSLLVSAGGLLCFRTSVTGELIICNPVSMKYRFLAIPKGYDCEALTDPVPDLLKPVVTLEGGKEAIEAFQRSFGREIIVGLLTERHKQWYKLVVAGISNGFRRTTLVYDSFTHRWKEGGLVPPGVRFWESGKNVNVNGFLYCITFTAGLPLGECDLDWPWSVVRYDSATDSWAEVRLGRRGSILPQLVEHRGRIFVVQRTGKAENEICFSELKEESVGHCLQLVSRALPSTLFPAKSWKRCPMIMQDWSVGQGEWIYIAARLREFESDCSNARGLAILAYHFSRNVWVQLPSLMDAPELCARFRASLNGYFSATWLHAFEPSLCAVIW